MKDYCNANTNMAVYLKVFFSDVPYKRQRLLGLSSKYILLRR